MRIEKKKKHGEGSLLTEQNRRDRTRNKNRRFVRVCVCMYVASFSSFSLIFGGPLNTDCRTSDTFARSRVERVLDIDFFFFSLVLFLIH